MDKVAKGILQVLLALEGRKNFTPILHISLNQAFPLPWLTIQLLLCLFHHFTAKVSCLLDFATNFSCPFHLQIIFLFIHLLYDIHKVKVLGLGWGFEPIRWSLVLCWGSYAGFSFWVIFLCFFETTMLFYGFYGKIRRGRAWLRLRLFFLLFLGFWRTFIIIGLIKKMLSFLGKLLVDSYNGVKRVPMRSRLTALVIILLRWADRSWLVEDHMDAQGFK